MSNAIGPTDWPNNMSADDRKVWLKDQIVKWVGEKKIEECLSALELGNLSMTEKMVAYRSILIMGGIRHCRNNPRAEARMPILTLIVYLSDNAKGTCHLPISKMQELLKRSRQCIVDNILALETDGSIGISRVQGMLNCYWPRIPTALVQMSPNPTWFVDAVTGTKGKVYRTIDEAIAAATNDQSSSVDQSSGVDLYRSSEVDRTSQVQQTNQSSPAAEPVKSSTYSISSLNLFSLPKAARGGSCNRGPHLSDAGFVISSEHKMIISMPTFESWRHRFSAIQDLEAKLQRLAAVILKRGIMHPGWTNPEAWMVGCLAEDNQKAGDAARITEAKVASAQRGQSAKTFRR